MKISKHTPNTHSIHVDLKNSKEKFRLGVFSDVHYDSMHCHRKLFKRHLEESDGVIIIGDLFDVMGCHRDPRSKPENIRPEYIRKDKGYLDTIVEDVYNFLLPFKDKLLLISRGNHEDEITRRHDTDIIDRLCWMLRSEGSQVQTGGYSGFVRLRFSMTTCNFSNILYYHHGAGGNAARSKDVLRSQIDAFKVPDADVIVSGHTHNKIHDPSNVKMTLTQDNQIKFKSMDWIKTGSYKRDDRTPGYGGWEVQKDFLPTKMGGWFLDFNVRYEEKNRELIRTVVEAT